MDLPSVRLALSHIDPSDSDLSDLSEGIEDTDLDMDDALTDAVPDIRAKREAISLPDMSDDESMDDISGSEDSDSPSRNLRSANHVSAKFEEVPTEAREINARNLS
jgi:hypothetical protein